ncbi:hypothetical protein GCM10010315_56270 [Streptomyces luteosporeus]|uniref:Uncharacterized protein n=1 Tax=Streptomyces luteosporeus TaxID=173856 RepID=A0ABN3U6F2_9ACTN
MVGVVEEEDEIAEADQGVRAVAGARQSLGVSVHVADHVDSHAAHPRVRAAATGRAPTCGYFPVTRRRG